MPDVTLGVPAAHAEAQAQAVHTFFHENGCISYDVVRALGVAGSQQQLRDYLQQVRSQCVSVIGGAQA